jgi:hypothetical protein
MENNEDIDAKQNYLRQEIVEQDYDPDDFLQYMTSTKEEEVINLDNWTMDELIIVIIKIIKDSSKFQSNGCQ